MQFLKDGVQTIVARNILNVETVNFLCAKAIEQSLNRFGIIHGEVSPCHIWEFSGENREHTCTNRSITVMVLLSRIFGFSYDKMCILYTVSVNRFHRSSSYHVLSK